MREIRPIHPYRSMDFGRWHGRTIVVLAGWYGRPWMYWPLAVLMVLRGYHCIVFTYDDEVFSSNPTKTCDNVLAVQDAVLARIRELETQGRTDIALMGFSLGAMIALIVANKTPGVSRVILNLAGIHPADAVWTWDVVKPDFKRALRDQGLTLDGLRAQWDAIAPESNINNLKGRRVLIYLARRDQMIPYAQGQRLVERLIETGCDCQLVTNNRLNHGLSGLYNFMRINIYVNFLAKS